MLQASFRNLLPTDKELERMLYEHVDKHMADIAAEIATETRQRAPKLKGLLVKSVRARPSKFEAGGYIVVVRAPHAHLVEYGHNIVDRKGVVRGKVRPHPFFRPAIAIVGKRVRSRLGLSAVGA
ncbi:HK97 gp10 family phage protein [Oleidesulfovibrio alaskensis]|jgi:hypothetical protein